MWLCKECVVSVLYNVSMLRVLWMDDMNMLSVCCECIECCECVVIILSDVCRECLVNCCLMWLW